VTEEGSWAITFRQVSMHTVHVYHKNLN
jgi:hypothetical protein